MELLLTEIQKISSELQLEIPNTTTHLQRDYLLKLSSLKARVNHLQPEAQYFYNEHLAKVTEKILSGQKDNIKGNSALIKNLIAGEMKTHQKLIDYVDRVSSTISLQSDNLRTVISFEKELMRQAI